MIGAVTVPGGGVVDAPAELARLEPGGVGPPRRKVPVRVRLPPGRILLSSLNSRGAYGRVSGSLWGDVGRERELEPRVEPAEVLIPELEPTHS